MCAHTCHMSSDFCGAGYNGKSLEPARLLQVDCIVWCVFTVDLNTGPSDLKQAENSLALS